jgi:hypothetical protein
MAETNKQPDWERIEADYRSGIMSLREIASEQGISEGAIRKRAKRDDWSRDLTERIRSRADDLVRKAEVRKEVRIDERVLIEAGAEAIAAVKLSHRADIRRYRSLVNQLMGELEEQTSNLELYQQLGELMASDSQDGPNKMDELYRKVISLPQRTKVMIDLANALKVLIGLERESYSINDDVTKVDVNLTTKRQTVQEVLNGLRRDY